MTPRPPSTPDRVTQQSGQLQPGHRTARPRRTTAAALNPTSTIQTLALRAADALISHSIPVPA